MERVSSQLTIFIRIALPTIWLATVVSLFVLLTIAVRGKAQVFSNPIVWGTTIFILGSGFAFIKFILWKLYRVDMDSRNIYVSNYFKPINIHGLMLSLFPKVVSYPAGYIKLLSKRKVLSDNIFISSLVVCCGMIL